jgi:hypothetical protein
MRPSSHALTTAVALGSGTRSAAPCRLIRPSGGERQSSRGGGNSDSHCLVEGSLVLTPDGKTRPVETCRVGQTLATFDRRTRAILATRITHVSLKHIRDSYLVINNELRITSDHPLLKAGADWMSAEMFSVGDRILSSIGGIDIVSIVPVERRVETVYLQTEHDNYLAHGERGPYVVHGRYDEQLTVSSASNEQDEVAPR